MEPIRKNREEELTTADIAEPKPKETVAESSVHPAPEVAGHEVEARRAGPQLVQRETPEPGETAARERPTPLFPEGELQEMRSRWTAIQTGFVDQPRRAVEQADSLVASAVKRLAERFADERSQLERQWERGDSVSTEDLRQALRQYRAFFDRVLAA